MDASLRVVGGELGRPSLSLREVVGVVVAQVRQLPRRTYNAPARVQQRDCIYHFHYPRCALVPVRPDPSGDPMATALGQLVWYSLRYNKSSQASYSDPRNVVLTRRHVTRPL